MEAMGAIAKFDWDVVNESELTMSQLLGTYQDQEPCAGIKSMFHPDHDAISCNWLYNVASSLFSPIADTASTSSFLFPTNESNSCELSNPDMIPEMETSTESMNIFLPEDQMAASILPVDRDNYFVATNSISLEDYCALPEDSLQSKRKVVESCIDNEDEILTENPKKKAWASTKVQKSTKSTHSKKTLKRGGGGDREQDENNGSYVSDDNSNASQEQNGDADGTSSDTKGKTRAGRGSATDTQSLYAKKRRERINERLRVLQNLVPSGTKVDISTMLEEAVQYVKFLQLQIKLLSSDDMWMYAPLAYLKIPFPLQRH